MVNEVSISVDVSEPLLTLLFQAAERHKRSIEEIMIVCAGVGLPRVTAMNEAEFSEAWDTPLEHLEDLKVIAK